MSKIKVGVLVGLVLVFAGYILWDTLTYSGPVMSAAVSSDGAYALTAHRENHLVLWNLRSKERQTISRNANIYSAYFIKGQPVFLWQDLEGRVVAQSVNGNVEQTFTLESQTYGHLMTRDLRHYYFSDLGWGIYRRAEDGSLDTLKAKDGKAFLGYMKLLNLAMDSDEKWLISSGSGEAKGFEPPYYRSLDDVLERAPEYKKLNSVALWELESGKPIAKLDGNSAKTHATISPDGQWVISGDENGIGLYWNTERPEERHRLARYHSGIFIDDTPYEMGDPRNRDTSGLIDAPPGTNNATIAQAFIHNSEYYLRFGNNSHIAALFKAGSPWPVKYFDLGESPELVTHGSNYSRNTAIATSPEAGVLVMGHRTGGGISVYQFDADKLTLDRVWVVE